MAVEVASRTDDFGNMSGCEFTVNSRVTLFWNFIENKRKRVLNNFRKLITVRNIEKCI